MQHSRTNSGVEEFHAMFKWIVFTTQLLLKLAERRPSPPDTVLKFDVMEATEVEHLHLLGEHVHVASAKHPRLPVLDVRIFVFPM